MLKTIHRTASQRISPQTINTLLQSVDLLQLIRSQVRLIKFGQEYHGHCPFHDDTTPSFTVVPHKGFYHCFGCQAHGNAITFIMTLQPTGLPRCSDPAERAGRPCLAHGTQSTDNTGYLHIKYPGHPVLSQPAQSSFGPGVPQRTTNPTRYHRTL